MIAACGDHCTEFGFKYIRRRSNCIIRVATRHILPDEHTELVCPIVPALRLNLDVFAEDVPAKLLCHLNIIFERGVCWGGIYPVGPESLIQRSDLEHKFIVEQDTLHAACCANRDFAHPEIAPNLIDNS